METCYGVYDRNSREVVTGTEEELLNKGFEFICGSEKAAYRRIFIMLSKEELQSELGVEIEKKAYADNFKNAPSSYQSGYFINERLKKM